MLLNLSKVWSKNDFVIDLGPYLHKLRDFIRLCLAKHPFGTWSETSFSELVKIVFSVAEFSEYFIALVVMENARVNNSNFNTVNPQVISKQDVKTIVHDSESYLWHHVTRILQVAFKQIMLTEMNNWILRAESFIWNKLIS